MTTPRYVLQKAFDHPQGEIGYCEPRDGAISAHWVAVRSCLEAGFLAFKRDASIGVHPADPRPKSVRTIYGITELGRAQLEGPKRKPREDKRSTGKRWRKAS